jgi:hypothetical protein
MPGEGIQVISKNQLGASILKRGQVNSKVKQEMRVEVKKI